jgi:hypothetical protein
MSITQDQFTFNTGRDIQLKWVAPDGTSVDISNILMFTGKAVYASITVDRLDGNTIHAELPKGWDGTIELSRKDANIDRMFGTIESNWIQLGKYNNGTVYAYVSEKDGTQTMLKFTNCAFKYDDSGDWAADKDVKLKVSFKATQRFVV